MKMRTKTETPGQNITEERPCSPYSRISYTHKTGNQRYKSRKSRKKLLKEPRNPKLTYLAYIGVDKKFVIQAELALNWNWFNIILSNFCKFSWKNEKKKQVSIRR